jgi:hypothetical protein
MDTPEQKAPKKRRPGGGRKRMSPEEKKKLISLTLPPWLLEWMQTQNESRAALIERAMAAQYNIKHD